MSSLFETRQAAADALLKTAALLRGRVATTPCREKIAPAGAILDLAKLRKLARP